MSFIFCNNLNKERVMDTCQFSYLGKKTDLKQTALGVEQSWEALCVKLDRDGPGLPDGTHYFTISVEGPELFAVDANGTNVYYHDEGKWHRYITAFDIQIGVMDDADTGCPPRALATAENSL
jgi:hypothetical protein